MALRWYWGIPLACLIGLPWYIAMGSIHGDAFIDTFLGYHNMTRFLSPEHAGKNHYWLYIVVLIAGFYPWTGTLPGILRRIHLWRKDPILLYLLTWAAFIFVFFSISSTQLFSYLLPIFPPISLLAGKYLTDLEESGHISKTLMSFHLVFAVATATAISLAPLTPVGGNMAKYSLSFCMILSALFSVWCIYRGRLRGFLMSQAALIFLFVVSVWGLFASPVSSLFTSEAIASRLAETERKSSIPLYIDTFYRPSIAFYQDIYGEALPEYDARKLEEAERNKENGVLLPGKSAEAELPPEAYVLVQKKVYKHWPEELQKASQILWEKDTAYLLYVKES